MDELTQSLSPPVHPAEHSGRLIDSTLRFAPMRFDLPMPSDSPIRFRPPAFAEWQLFSLFSHKVPKAFGFLSPDGKKPCEMRKTFHISPGWKIAELTSSPFP